MPVMSSCLVGGVECVSCDLCVNCFVTDPQDLETGYYGIWVIAMRRK